MTARAVVPPSDLDAEGVVLSCLLMGSPADTLARCSAAGLLAQHFYATAHQHIYEAAGTVAGQGRPLDVVAIKGRLSETGQLQTIGGSPYLAQLLDCTPASAHPEAHALTVIEMARRRALLEVMTRTAILLRGGELDHAGAWEMLREHRLANR